MLAFQNISAVYVGVIAFVLFAVWIPERFLTGATFQATLTQGAVTALLAIGLTLPLAAGTLDLSVAHMLGAANVTAAWAMGEGHSPWLAAALAIALGLLVGGMNGLLVVKARIESIVATLGVSSMLSAFLIFRSGNQQIVGIDPAFKRLTTNKFLGIPWHVYFVLLIAVAVWYVLEHRPTGRYLYATGSNAEAARLSGVRTSWIIFGSLVAAALVASMAGIMVTARVGVGSPSIGPPYLIPAFAAAFLGATQVRPGRFNVWGTLIAVYMLVMGVKGLQLAGVPFWIPDLFNGVALLVAVGLSRRRKRLSERED